DAHGFAESRAFVVDDELRRFAAGPSELWLVADLWPGHGKSKIAGIHRALSVRLPGQRHAKLDGRVFAFRLSGHLHWHQRDRSRAPDSAHQKQFHLARATAQTA